jgi:pimeloyl-ACP methyl ester carboxylesterase/mannose-6-phosphate isomerase-like protein (cupin superfamily)
MTTYEIGRVPVTVTERGEGRPVLLLHGGAGPASVAGFAGLLAEAGLRAITPVHPGFDGTSRPETLTSIAGLAELYAGLLDELGATDVTVVGNSIGGWIAAEIALLRSPRVARVVLVDAVGIEVPEHPPVDFFSLTLDQVSQLSYHDPDAYRLDPDALPPEQRALLAGNRSALAVYGGQAMVDPTLAARLAGIDVPVLVVWGDSDRIVLPAYGEAFAAAIPTARFTLLTGTGHVPQVETPGPLLDVIADFVDGASAVSVVGPKDGEISVNGPIQMRIIEDGGNTAHRLGVGEITIGPRTAGPPQHRHARHDEGFYVVSGTARFTVGAASHDVPAGGFVMVPPGAPHTFANPTDEPLVLLNTFTPDLYVQYFRDLRAQVSSGRELTVGLVEEVMSRYSTTPA